MSDEPNTGWFLDDGTFIDNGPMRSKWFYRTIHHSKIGLINVTSETPARALPELLFAFEVAYSSGLAAGRKEVQSAMRAAIGFPEDAQEQGA